MSSYNHYHYSNHEQERACLSSSSSSSSSSDHATPLPPELIIDRNEPDWDYSLPITNANENVTTRQQRRVSSKQDQQMQPLLDPLGISSSSSSTQQQQQSRNNSNNSCSDTMSRMQTRIRQKPKCDNDELDGPSILMGVEKQSFRSRASLLLCRPHNMQYPDNGNDDDDEHNNNNNIHDNHNVDSYHGDGTHLLLRRFQQKCGETTRRPRPRQEGLHHGVEKLVITPLSPSTEMTTTATTMTTTPSNATTGSNNGQEQLTPINLEKKHIFFRDDPMPAQHQRQRQEQFDNRDNNGIHNHNHTAPVQMISVVDAVMDDEISAVTTPDDDYWTRSKVVTATAMNTSSSRRGSKSSSYNRRLLSWHTAMTTATPSSIMPPDTENTGQEGCFGIMQPFPMIQDLTSRRFEQLSQQLTLRGGCLGDHHYQRQWKIRPPSPPRLLQSGTKPTVVTTTTKPPPPLHSERSIELRGEQGPQHYATSGIINASSSHVALRKGPAGNSRGAVTSLPLHSRDPIWKRLTAITTIPACHTTGLRRFHSDASSRSSPSNGSGSGGSVVSSGGRKRVMFADPVVTAVRVRPLTDAKDVSNLFFDPGELDILSNDRANRVPDEQFECVATPTGQVSVFVPKK